jgi:hypothetical protein
LKINTKENKEAKFYQYGTGVQEQFRSYFQGEEIGLQ